MTSLPFNLSDLGIWPENCADQRDWLNRLVTQMNSITTYINTHTQDLIVLEQINEPTQTEWEIAWAAQTGKPFPIGINAVLWWWDTSINDLGGIYGVTKGDNVVRPQQSAYPRNATVMIEQSVMPFGSVSGSPYIDDDFDVVTPLVFTTKQILTLELSFGCQLDITAGTEPVGVDFKLDGVKIGTSQYNLAADVGLIHRNDNGILYAKALVPNVSPGVHTVELMIGSVQSPTTPSSITVNSNGGLSNLQVRGFGL